MQRPYSPYRIIIFLIWFINLKNAVIFAIAVNNLIDTIIREKLDNNFCFFRLLKWS